MTMLNLNPSWMTEDAQLVTAYLTVTKTKEAIDFYNKVFSFQLAENLVGDNRTYIM